MNCSFHKLYLGIYIYVPLQCQQDTQYDWIKFVFYSYSHVE
jgi:hypothetical protein